MRGSSAADEDLAMRRVIQRLEIVQHLELHKDGKHQDLALPGSELGVDDDSMGYLQSSHLLAHCLGIALDALRTSRWILSDPETGGLRLPMTAHYSVLRTAIESSGLACWLLAPDVRRVRLARSLAFRWDDNSWDDKLKGLLLTSDSEDDKTVRSGKAKALRAQSQRFRKGKNYLRELGHAAGIAEEEFAGTFQGYGPMLWEAAAATQLPPKNVRGTWQVFSGMTHPSFNRSMDMSKVDILGDERGGVSLARIEASWVSTNWALDAAMSLYYSGMRMVAKRGGDSSFEIPKVDGSPVS